jgi:energy-coupling factor transporter ATP-binding protein EcfA2
MLINEIRLEGYRGLGDRQFQFNPEFNFLIGDSGSGKSSLLDAVATVLSAWTAAVGAPDRHTLRSSDANQFLAKTWPVRVLARGKLFDHSYEWGRSLSREDDIARLVRTEPFREIARFLVEQLQSSQSWSALPLPVVAYIGERVKPRESFPRELGDPLPRTILRNAYQAGLSLSLDPDEFERWLAFQASEEDFSTVLAAWEHCFSDDSEDGYSFDRDGSRIHFRRGYMPMPAINSWGEGANWLPLIVAGLARRILVANRSNPYRMREVGGVVLIEHLEGPQHPNCQRRIVERLRRTFPRIQFIVSTNSPFIIQTAREGEVVKLDGHLASETTGRSIEEILRLAMGVTNLERSPRYRRMLESARQYLRLVSLAKESGPTQREAIREELLRLLAPFADNPAYTALLERKGIIEPNNPEENGGFRATS